MKVLILIAIAALQAGCSGVTSNPSTASLAGPVASLNDFRILAGDGWKGHLTYLDYSSGERSKIPVEIQIDAPGTRSISYAIKYPGETQYNSREEIRLSRDGRTLNGDAIISRTQDADGDLVLVTAYQGRDDNRKADFRVTYEIGQTTFSISKEVRFEDEKEFFLRNQYLLSR